MFRIFGPPGTGKTTTLLNMVDDALESGINPVDIAFLAFTRKAANEAKERAAKRFNLDPDEDLRHFRTLHSLALSKVGIRPEEVMQPSNYRELGGVIGHRFQNVDGKDNDGDIFSGKINDPVLSLINLARLKKTKLRDEYNNSNLYADWNLVKYVDESVTVYKEKFGLYDFTDMLSQFIANADQCCPRFKLTFLDEAQDLSPLQWDIAHILDKKSERMYCAGDDDQAIYRWAGADVEQFINLPGGAEILAQSYRVPSSVHRIAERIANRINKRYRKEYNPRKERGSVAQISGLAELDMSHGSWLIMGQAGYMLWPLSQELRGMGVLFNDRGRRSISDKISTAVNAWERLRKGTAISGEEARCVYSHMSTKTRIERGFKKLPGVEDSDQLTMQDLIDKHGLLADPESIWHEAMDLIPDNERAYIVAMLRRGEKFNAEPRVTVSTIHGSKGGEADNVVLLTDLSPAAEAAASIDADDLHRVFYVGVTRTRENLYLVEPEDLNRSYLI
jgi:DNA helicase II / ATP-dependent DNA helicase PcrA